MPAEAADSRLPHGSSRRTASRWSARLRARQAAPLARRLYDPRRDERAHRLGLPHVYLSYSVEGLRADVLADQFLPQEHLGMNGWEKVG